MASIIGPWVPPHEGNDDCKYNHMMVLYEFAYV